LQVEVNKMTTLGYIFGVILALVFGFLLGKEHPSKAATKSILNGQASLVLHLKEEIKKHKTLYTDLIKLLKDKSENRKV